MGNSKSKLPSPEKLSSGQGEISSHAKMSTIEPLPDEAVGKWYSTWVKSPLIPEGREEAPSLDDLCTALIATVDDSQSSKAAILTDGKPSQGAISPASNGLPKGASTPPPTSSPQNALPRSPNPPNTTLLTTHPTFQTYTDLHTLTTSPQPPLQHLAKTIHTIFLTWLEEERVPATWVTPNILLDGILGSLDAATLTTLCTTHAFTHVALLSIHPDDWVVGGAWEAHGRLPWAKRPASARERKYGVDERLVAPLWEDVGRRKEPGWIKQSGEVYRSPVVDQLVIPLEDGAGASLLVHLPDICTFIAAHSARPDVLVVVNCKMGHSRSSAAQEAFVVQAVAQRLRAENTMNGWAAKSVEAQTADLRAVRATYHTAFEQRRPGLKEKFPRQLDAWAAFLAAGEPVDGPAWLEEDKAAAAGGEGMRDAAVLACYRANWVLTGGLVAHYERRVGMLAGGKGRNEATIRRFGEAEGVLRRELEGREEGAPWVSLREFVRGCKKKI